MYTRKGRLVFSSIRHRQTFRKKAEPKRKPVSPPTQFLAQPRVGFDYRERAAGAEVEERMDALRMTFPPGYKGPSK